MLGEGIGPIDGMGRGGITFLDRQVKKNEVLTSARFILAHNERKVNTCNSEL